VVTRTDYNQIAVNAAYSVLIEIVRVLGEYRDNIVLIGGWVPQILFQNEEDRTLIERDAFERVNYLLQKLGIV
jgi:hypothetical protein